MKKVVKKIAKYFCFIMIGLSLGYFIFNKPENKLEEINEPKIKKNINTLSMMLETEAGSGNYEMTTASSWPTDGYIFNTTLSKCENGGELSWDDENKRVLMSGNVSDKCYVYFDVIQVLLADYVKSLYTGTQGENGIYYHDATLTNGAGDNSYRYSGADPNNYVCFGTNTTPCPTDNLYRMIGVFGDQVKLVKYDYANSNLLGTNGDYSGTGTYLKSNYSTYKGSLTTINRYYWNDSTSTNTWSESLLNKTNLNTNFITNIGTEWANKIATTTWKVGGNTDANIYSKTPSVAYQNEVVNPVTTNTTDNTTEYTAKIGLMYVSDYGFAADPSAWTTTLDNYDSSSVTAVNWMYLGLYEWTISRRAAVSNSAFFVANGGFVHFNDVYHNDLLPGRVSDGFGVRPSFNLESSITYVSGDGTQDSPIIIN